MPFMSSLSPWQDLISKKVPAAFLPVDDQLDRPILFGLLRLTSGGMTALP